MPWRLLGVILVLAVFLAFIGFNLNNTCDISFGFTVFSGVPVYVTIFASFMLGMFCSLPFIISSAVKRKEKPGKFPKPKKNSPRKGTALPKKPGTEGYGID